MVQPGGATWNPTSSTPPLFLPLVANQRALTLSLIFLLAHYTWLSLSLSHSFFFSFLFPLHTSLLPSLFGHHGLTETRHVLATEEDQLSTVRPPEFQPKTTLCVAYAWSLSVRFRPPFFLDSNVVRPQFLAKLAWLEPTFDDLQNRAPPH